MQWQGFTEVLSLGAWPGSPDPSRFSTVIDEQVLQRWDRVRSSAPTHSLQAFLKELQAESHEWGELVGLLRDSMCFPPHAHASRLPPPAGLRCSY